MNKNFQYLYSLVALCIFSLLWFSCEEFDYGYKSFEPDQAETDYSRKFANREDVNVNIETETPGAPYFIYFSNPYDKEGNFTDATAYLQGITPINTTFSIPNHVDSLYVVTPMREMRILPAGDVSIFDSNIRPESNQTRVDIDQKPYALTDIAAYNADLAANTLQPYYSLSSDPFPNDGISIKTDDNPDVTDAVMNYVNSTFQKGVVADSELSKNTDLTFEKSNQEGASEYVAVWVTCLGHGANDPSCKVWCYFYPSNIATPGFSDILMIGLDESGNLTTHDVNKGKPDQASPLFTILSGNTNTDYPSVFIGYIKDGYNIGFAYQELGVNGQSAKIRFTTPSLNQTSVGGDFASGGFIIHQDFGDHPYNFVGIEKQANPDNDFNDALLLIETNPEITPKETIDITETKTELKRTKGYYLFEDLYKTENPQNNDNDFNDVVLFYEKILYKTIRTIGSGNSKQEYISYSCDFSAELLANACTNTNTIGIYHRHGDESGTITNYTLFTDVTGEMNMQEAPLYTGEGKKSISFLMAKPEQDATNTNGDIILPFLRTTEVNGDPVKFDPQNPNEGNIYAQTFATSGFPYAIEIPFVEGKPFRWMKEGIIITEGYTNWNQGAWYSSPSNEEKVVPRAAGSTY